MKLRQMNEKLVKELKVLSNSLDKSLEKARTKPKPLDPYVDANIKAREKEVEEAQKKIKGLQKEISSLRSKLEAKTGYEKIIDLENKLKEADNKYNELQKELKGLEKIEENQEKELQKLIKNQEPNTKIQELNEQLKTAKEKNKELEKKLQEDSATYQKQHVHLLDLQEKLQKLKEEKIQWKKAIAEKLPAPTEEKETKEKKSEEEILKNSIRSLRKRIEFERGNSKKIIDNLKTELSSIQLQIKEAEQENKLNAAKLKELKPLVRHNQLKPLNDETDESHSNMFTSLDPSQGIPNSKKESLFRFKKPL